MTKVERRLVEAYRRQEDIYNRILEMVQKQKKLLSSGNSGQMGPVLDICAQIEEELSKISSIESEVEEEKRHWMEHSETLPSRLEDVLDRIKLTIDKTRALQEQMSATLAGQRYIGPHTVATEKRTGGASSARQAQNAYSHM